MAANVKPGPKSRTRKAKINVEVNAEDEINNSVENVEEFEALHVMEAMTCFNQRSEGRVVISPPERMAALKTHVTDERWYFCRFCGRSYKDLVKYKEHLDEHEIEEEIPSPNQHEQDPLDSEDEILINYKNKMSPPEETSNKVWSCTICKKKFTTHAKKREHMMKLHYQHTCDGCGLRFNKRYTMAQHYQRCHDSSNEFPCLYCSSNMSTHRGLQKHTSTFHRKQELARVAKLKKATANAKAKVSKNTKNVVSASAGVLTSRKGILVNSVRSKVVSKILYRCKICKKTFSKAFLLRDHHRLHTGAKPFECKMCPQTFRDGKSLWAHKNSNHSNQAVKCPQCTCTFKTLTGVTCHIRRIHEAETQ